MKEQIKTLEKELSDEEIANLLGSEFKTEFKTISVSILNQGRCPSSTQALPRWTYKDLLH